MASFLSVHSVAAVGSEHGIPHLFVVSTYKEEAGQVVIIVGAGVLHKLDYRMKYRLNHVSEIHPPVSHCTRVNANQNSHYTAQVQSSQFVSKAPTAFSMPAIYIYI